MFMVIALLPNLFIWSDRLISKGINRTSLTRKLLNRKGSKVAKVELREEPENENVAQNFN